MPTATTTVPMSRAAKVTTTTVMTGHRAGHLSPHNPIEMTGSVAGHGVVPISRSADFNRPTP